MEILTVNELTQRGLIIQLAGGCYLPTQIQVKSDNLVNLNSFYLVD